jgi:hypothetical protein
MIMKVMKKTFVLAAAVSLVCLSSAGAMAANKLIVKDSGGTNDKFVVTDLGYVGVGGVTPTYPVHIVGAGASSTTSFYMINNGRTAVAATDSPAFQLMRNNATGVNGKLPRANDRLGSFLFGSVILSANKYSAQLAAFATGTWSATSTPGYLSFGITTTGNVSPTEKMKLRTVGTTSQAIVDVSGGVRINSSGTKPTCDAAIRGTLWFVQVAAGNANGDLLQICAQLPSSSALGWRTVTIP